MSCIFHSRYQQQVETARRVGAGLEVEEITEEKDETKENENEQQRTQGTQRTSQADSC
jgi:hypothetical protein